MPTEYLTFRNQPILKITQENSYIKLQIGLKKAQLIIDSIEVIKGFIALNTQAESPGAEIKPSETPGVINSGAEV